MSPRTRIRNPGSGKIDADLAGKVLEKHQIPDSCQNHFSLDSTKENKGFR